MKKITIFIICAILVSLIILGCTATEVSKVPPADAVKQTTDESVKTETTENSQLTDDQILNKYDDGLDEAMKELDSLE